MMTDSFEPKEVLSTRKPFSNVSVYLPKQLRREFYSLCAKAHLTPAKMGAQMVQFAMESMTEDENPYPPVRSKAWFPLTAHDVIESTLHGSGAGTQVMLRLGDTYTVIYDVDTLDRLHNAINGATHALKQCVAGK